MTIVILAIGLVVVPLWGILMCVSRIADALEDKK